MLRKVVLAAGCLLMLSATAQSADLTAGLQEGTVDLQSAGPLAFGPNGILFVADPRAAQIVAIATGDVSGNPEAVVINVESIGDKIAAALGTTARNILINDLAVNPLSGRAYLSVSRGRGPDAAAVLLSVDPEGNIAEVSLKQVRYSAATLPNPPAPGEGEVRRGRRRPSARSQSITDLTYYDGRLLVAGLSNEEFASTLRSIPFPFQSVDQGTSVEVYHGAHGRFETRSPVRTFATYEIKSQPHLLAAYTCTPLVRFPLSDLAPGKKILGTTVAELGNRNRPLDMVVYNKAGNDYILMANSSRGMMKITTEGIAEREGITTRIRGTAGQDYETIEDLNGVVQLARLNSQNALVLIQTDDGTTNLRTVALP